MAHNKQYYKDFYEGNSFESLSSGTFEVIEYVDSGNVKIRFLDGTETFVSSGNLRKGRVKNPNKINKLYGVAECDVVVNRSDEEGYKAYTLYRSLITRVYDEKFLLRNENYKDVSVCDTCLQFSNFKSDVFKMKGFDKSISDKWELDKDLLSEGNKVYSPETCCFVPPEINSLLVKGNNTRVKCLIGVRFNKKLSKYQADVSKNGDKVYLGLYNTEIEAFQAYKKAKESYIKEVSCRWKDKIDEKVYKALLVWEIEEND